jgi:CheY-like chemotaxis protein
MDCQMPVMDGYCATAAIRAAESAGRRTPIIALTANAFAEDRKRCLDAGMDDYLAKPVSLASLRETVGRWLAATSALRDDSAGTPPSSVASSRSVARPEAEPEQPGARAGLHPMPIVDDDVVAGLCALGSGESDFFARAVALFGEDAPAQLRAIRTAHGAGNAGEIRQRAHSLKSSSGMIGAPALAELCKSLERIAEDQPGAACAEAIERIEAMLAEVLTALNQRLVRRAGTIEALPVAA